MAALTEDQQRAFVDRIVELYGHSETAAAVTASDKGLDPTKRLAKLTPLQTAAAQAEAAQSAAEVAFRRATEVSRSATAAAYKEASEAADALAGELGDKHALSQQIRSLRRSMSNPAARGAKSSTATKPTA